LRYHQFGRVKHEEKKQKEGKRGCRRGETTVGGLEPFFVPGKN
jgi:hypothetical protein